MRQIFEAELKQVGDDLAEMSRLVEQAIVKAGTALLTADIELAQQVVAQDQAIDELERDLDERCVLLLAQQQPVATDLRVVVSALRISSSLERMGDLARHIAKVARLRYPGSAVPADLRSVVVEMGRVAEGLVAKTGSIIAARDVEAARSIDRDDDAMDDLHRALVERISSPAWPHGTETAVDMTLVSRYYERFADHAVSVAHRVIFLVTGQFGPEAEASHEDDEDDARLFPHTR